MQTWTAPYSGYYYVEAYGAAGGNDASRGGYGGYVKMYVYLDKGTNLYVTCGQKGWAQYGKEAKTSAANPTYNGGGRAGYSTTDSLNGNWFSGVGGGATSIAISNHGELKDFANCKNDVLMVAGGGAGGSNNSSGQGGLVLYTGSSTDYSVMNGADTSLLNGQFALGSNPGTNDGGGGGGGWIGGKSGLDAAGNSAGGGASFVNTSQNCIPIELVPDYNIKDGYVHITSTDYTGYYTISYDYDGGTANNPISYSVKQDDFKLKNPEKRLYKFIGWTGSNGDVPQLDVTIEKGSTGNKSYKANYNILLDLNGYLDGKTMYSLGNIATCDIWINGVKVADDVTDFNGHYPSGTKYEINDIKVKSGYIYENKLATGAENSVSDFSGTITKPVGIYPSFKSKSVNITFHRNTSSSDTQTTLQKVTYGVANQKFAANTFKRDGYKFKGWSFNKNATKTDYPDLCSVADSWIDLHYSKTDLYAVWEPISWTVKYDANGGTGTMADSKHVYESGSKLNQNQFSKTGYTFNGWQASRVKDGKTEWLCANTDNSWISGSEWYEKDKIPSNRKIFYFYDCQIMQISTYIDGDVITMHALWTVNTYSNLIKHWTEGFKYSEGDNDYKNALKLKDTYFSASYKSSIVMDSTKAVKIPNGFYLKGLGTPEVNGTFKSYSMGLKLTQKSVPMWFEYYYDPISYSITYDLNGGINNNANPLTYTVLYGVSLKAPTKAGYTFAGWYDENGNRVIGINEGCNATFSSADDLYAKLAARTTGNRTLTAHWSYNPVSVKIPQILTGDHTGKSQFRVKCDSIVAGRIAVEPDSSFNYTQDKLAVKANVKRKSSSSVIDKNNYSVAYDIITDKPLTAGCWQGSFNIKLTLTKE